MNEEMLLSYYGDDFTGSTDVMEALASNGVATALFLSPPSQAELNTFRLIGKSFASEGKLQAFGVPGISRSLNPEEMKAELPPIFEELAKIPSRFFHYKTCSTFDSAPQIGNISLATEIATRYFPASLIPLVVGAPSLQRYTVFGNLFAGVEGEVFRIDRHPTMSCHPLTPMSESDLRLHLKTLGHRPAKLIDIIRLRTSVPACIQYAKSLKNSEAPFLLFDTLTPSDLRRIGEIAWSLSQDERQFIVGSSGFEYALCHYLNATSQLDPCNDSSLKPASQIIALSGSASPVTAKQIQRALELGFADIRIQTLELLEENSRSKEIERVSKQAISVLSGGQSPMIFTALGPQDPAIQEVKEKAVQHASNGSLSTGQIIARSQGTILRNILEKAGRQRIVVAGGDTSGYAAKALNLKALEFLAPIAPGAPICIAHSDEPKFHGIEIALKGGQNGKANYFETVLSGT